MSEVVWTPPATVVQGNARTVPDTLPDGCVSALICSPPFFGLRSYGTEPQIWGGDGGCAHVWDQTTRKLADSGTDGTAGSTLQGAKTSQVIQRTLVTTGTCRHCGAWRGELGQEPTVAEYVAHLVSVFAAWRRVLHPTGVCFVNLADSYSNAGQSNNRRAGKTTGGKARYTACGELGPKQLLGVPWRFAFAMQDDGWILRSDVVWAKGNPMPESVTDRFTRSHEYVFMFARQERYYFDHVAVQEPSVSDHGSGNGFKRAARQSFLDGDGTARGSEDQWELRPTRSKRDVWAVNTVGFAGAHYATWPPALVLPMVLAGSSAKGVCTACGAPWARVTERDVPSLPGAKYTTVGWQPTCTCAAPVRPALVADPFSGVGTTGAIAIQHGRHYLGVDLNPDGALTTARLDKIQLALLEATA